MSSPLLPREQVAERFAVSPTILIRYEARGLIQPLREGPVEGYGPAEIRRLWTILSLQRDLGINLAGVEAILKLRAHMDQVHRELTRFAEEFREALEADLGPDVQD